jgi:phosphoribosylformylglycinamidine synthase
VVGALQLQELARPSEEAADRRAARAAGPGENAGAVDIGDGLAAVFKIESHNHPSFIEPYQGAATGCRRHHPRHLHDGRAPIALMNSLRFGEWTADGPRPPHRRRRRRRHCRLRQQHRHSRPSAARSRSTIATPANPLVNVFCLGICAPDALVKGARSASAIRVLRRVQDGRDGIHGATMASAEFDEKSARSARRAGRRSVHGEAAARSVLELMKTDALMASRTWERPGLTCSTCEMGRARRRRHRDRRACTCRRARPA